ncbi:MAG: enoyl-CoA hydratase [Syntrophaceae bacterium]|nr:enoyl-CoA hydratase [Syntrophaceae bacterium]
MTGPSDPERRSILEFRFIRFETFGPIGVLTLNHPERRNALSLDMLRELALLTDHVAGNESVRVLIIRAAGKVFSSGHNLGEMVDGDFPHYQDIFRTCSAFMHRLQKLPQPVIAQVHGVATAAGCQLVAACDLALAEEDATFGTPGVRIGVFCTTPAIPLVRAVGRKRALEMLFTGRMVTAREALEWGLVNRVVPLDRLETETLSLAEEIAQASPLTLAIGKRAFYTQVNLDDEQAYTFGSEIMVGNLFAGDAREGMRAFLEKRKPLWKGK